MSDIKRRVRGPNPGFYNVGQRIEAELETVRGKEWMLAVVTRRTKLSLRFQVIGTGCEITWMRDVVVYRVRPLLLSDNHGPK